MDNQAVLTFDPTRAADLCPPYAGVFVCPGAGRHVRRVIESHELIFVAAGVLQIAEEGQEFVVGKDQALLLPAGREHYGTHSYPPDLKHFWVHFLLPPARATKRRPAVALSRLTTLVQPDRLTELFLLLLHDHTFSVTGDPPPSTKGRQHLSDTWRADYLERASAGLVVTQMLCELARPGLASLTETDAPAVVLAQKAAMFIAAHARGPIGTASVAAALDCNPNYLSRVFRKVHGHTLTEAIHLRRIYEAKLLLIEESTTIEQIARTCGFGSAKYMGLLFHRHAGMSPMSYRQRFTVPASSIVTI